MCSLKKNHFVKGKKLYTQYKMGKQLKSIVILFYFLKKDRNILCFITAITGLN